MKLSAQSVILIVLVLNLFLSGMTLLENLAQSSEESARMLSTPVDFRYHLPAEPRADPTVGAQNGSVVVANSGRVRGE